MNIQIFGTKKCAETRKAERWFKEHGQKFQFIDLAEKGISPGEFRSIETALGLEALVDKEGKRYRERGLSHMEIDIREELILDPLLLLTPLVREGRRATVGLAIRTWEAWIRGK